MTIAVRPTPIRFRGRSFLAVVLTPEAPLDSWFAGLDMLSVQAPGFFRKRPVVVDVSLSATSRAELRVVLDAFAARNVRIAALEGAQPSWITAETPPMFIGGRDAEGPDLAAETVAAPQVAVPAPKPVAAAPVRAAVEPAGPVGSLLVREPVRSGRSIFHPEGDVIVVGSVASGAEIVAGGSIHVYGALRGRAIAGCGGNAEARIFCRRMEAELLSIDGLYKTTEDLAPDLAGRPVQAWLDGDRMRLEAIG